MCRHYVSVSKCMSFHKAIVVVTRRAHIVVMIACMYISICMYVCMYVYVYIYIYIYIYICNLENSQYILLVITNPPMARW